MKKDKIKEKAVEKPKEKVVEKVVEKKPAFVVKKGMSITTKKGIKGEGKEITAEMLVGGIDTLNNLCKKGFVVG